METHYLDTHVGKVQYRRGGAGPDLVYLHSANGEGEGLLLLDVLAERYDVVAPMFPGFGDSEGLDQIDDMEDAIHGHAKILGDRRRVEQSVAEKKRGHDVTGAVRHVRVFFDPHHRDQSPTFDQNILDRVIPCP